jgi:phosphohistidine swiveling domain-containing protein
MPDLTPILFQVRRITTQPNWNRAVARRIDSALAGIQSFVRSRLQRMEGAFGGTTVLAQMPDWNPAEMIGRAPRALAMSLYQTLITDHAWRTARETMGYAVPAGQPLMVSLFGQPFIDTRLSFHSYLPADIERDTAEKLVDSWVAKLAANPSLHDKVEFDVAVTCYSFDIEDRVASRAGDALNPDELQSVVDAFRRQLGRLVNKEHPGSIDQANKKIEQLAASQNSREGFASDPSIQTLFRMIDECIHLGTIPFATLARHGFIAKTLLLSLTQRGIISEDDMRRLQSSVRTVASDIVDDMRLLQSGKMSRSDFMRQYGHLRPGTYDIRSLRYDQMPEFGAQASSSAAVEAKADFTLGAKQRGEIDRLLTEEGFSDWSADRLIDYVHAATAGREFGKFVFTRSVSDMLELIASFGEKHGLSREELSHVPLASLLQVASSSGEGSIEDRLRAISELEAEKHALSSAIRLPQALSDEAGVHVVPFQVSHPNFITDKRAVGACLHLDSSEPFDRLDTTLDGKIILIERADPGFDWIFSYRIAGLVTKYGGANSHMAIRCAEFGIPAAIGCGEQRFAVLMDAGRILLDCQASLIQELH